MACCRLMAPAPRGQMKVLGPTSIIRDVNVGQPVVEGGEQCLRPVRLPQPKAQVRVADVEVEADLGTLSNIACRSSTPEKCLSRFSTMMRIPRAAASSARSPIASAFIFSIWFFGWRGTLWSGCTFTSSTPASANVSRARL